MKILKFLFHILLTIWMLPQEILGIIIAAYYRSKYVGTIGGCMFFVKKDDKATSSVTLGHFAICAKVAWDVSIHSSHEYGHHIQSRILGPLYLLVIGLPSILMCSYEDDHEKYLEFYTENWAINLGLKFFDLHQYYKYRYE